MNINIENFNVEVERFIENIKYENKNNHKICPKCKETRVVKNGTFKGIQRYKCKECGKSFSDVTNTPFYRSKKPLAYWLIYAKFMFSGMTLRQCKVKLNINIATAFYWRHKLLECLFFFEEKELLDGEIQLSDVYFYENFKGCKGKKSLKRHNPFIKRTRVEECVSVLCAKDAKGKVIADAICKSRFDNKGVKLWLDKRVELKPKAKFISSVAKFNNKASIKVFNKRIVKCGPEETAEGRALGRRLEGWIGKKFNGVATKYLNNYLVWFKHEVSGSFKNYRDFFLKKLNILLGGKEPLFFASIIENLKEKKIILYGQC